MSNASIEDQLLLRFLVNAFQCSGHFYSSADLETINTGMEADLSLEDAVALDASESN